jgi:peptide/nickel transport system substrate-binding protein
MADGQLPDTQERRLTRDQFLRRAAAAGVVALVSGCGSSSQTQTQKGSAPRRGGTLRFGGAGGSSKDYMDPGVSFSDVDAARDQATFEPLAGTDAGGNVVLNSLAEEFSSTTPDVWTIRVRDGIEFHNGKTLGADDVIYSIQRMANPKVGLAAAAQLASIDPSRMTKLDRRTVRLVLKQKDVTILPTLSSPWTGIVPVGYSPHRAGGASVAEQIGTGAYMLKSYTPGQQSVHVRFPHYWRTTYLDELVITDLTDTARVNALLGGQVDAATQIPSVQAKQVAGSGAAHLLVSPSQTFGPLLMQVKTPPFNDVRVRQAMRLLANRPQMVALALGGYGRVGNDVPSPFDPAYDAALPQRQQDIQQAQSLLKAAGHQGLTVTLVTAAVLQGLTQACTVFAENAKAAGVKVNVNVIDSSTLYGPRYLKWPFSVDYYSGEGYLQQVAVWGLPTSPYNETGWPDAQHASYVSLYKEARSTLDPTKRTEIIHAMQQIEHDAGGAIIWGFVDHTDGYGTKVNGLHGAQRTPYPMNNYGQGFRSLWLS